MAKKFDILARTEGLKERFEEVQLLITDPSVISDQKRFMRLSKEYKELENLTKKSDEYRLLLANLIGKFPAFCMIGSAPSLHGMNTVCRIRTFLRRSAAISFAGRT